MEEQWREHFSALPRGKLRGARRAAGSTSTKPADSLLGSARHARLAAPQAILLLVFSFIFIPFSRFPCSCFLRMNSHSLEFTRREMPCPVSSWLENENTFEHYKQMLLTIIQAVMKMIVVIIG